MKVMVGNSQKLIGNILTAVIVLIIGACSARSEEELVSLPISNNGVSIEMLNKARERLNLAEESFKQEKFSRAIEESKDGIKIIGQDYVSEKILDDTGTKFTLAKIEEEKDNLKQAAALYIRVLESRITLFELR